MRLGVDPRRFRLLFSHYLRLDLERKGGAAIDDSPVLVQTAYNFVLAFFFSAAFYARFDAFRFHFFAGALVASMTAVLCLTEFAAPLLFPRDRAILGPLPLAPADVLAARLAALGVYAGLNVMSLAFIPAVLSYWTLGGAGAAVLAFAWHVLMGLAVPGLLVAIVALVLKVRGGRDPGEIAPAIQVGGVLAVFLLLLVSFGAGAGRAGADSFPVAFAFLPQAWTAAGLAALCGAPIPESIARAAVPLTLLAAVFPLAAITLPALFARGYGRAIEGAPRAPGRPRLSDRLARGAAWLVARRPAERAGFLLAWTQMARDGAFRARLYPLLGVPLALLVAAAAGGGAGAGERGLLSFFFLYVGPIVFAPPIGLLPFSSGAAEAAVSVRAAPLERPGEYLVGAVKAVVVRLAAPYYLVLALVLPGPLSTTALDAAAAFVVAAALAAVFSLFVRSLPFTREPGRLEAVVPMDASLYAMIGLAPLGFLHASAEPLSLGLLAYAAAMIATLLVVLALARDRRGFLVP